VNLALANMIVVLAGQVLLLATPAGLDRALATSESGAIEEIIFAVRQPQGPHWYENLGSAITDVNDKAYGSRGYLCKLNLKSEKVTLLLEDPRRAVRDPQVNYRGDQILRNRKPKRIKLLVRSSVHLASQYFKSAVHLRVVFPLDDPFVRKCHAERLAYLVSYFHLRFRLFHLHFHAGYHLQNALSSSPDPHLSQPLWTLLLSQRADAGEDFLFSQLEFLELILELLAHLAGRFIRSLRGRQTLAAPLDVTFRFNLCRDGLSGRGLFIGLQGQPGSMAKPIHTAVGGVEPTPVSLHGSQSLRFRPGRFVHSVGHFSDELRHHRLGRLERREKRLDPLTRYRFQSLDASHDGCLSPQNHRYDCSFVKIRFSTEASGARPWESCLSPAVSGAPAAWMPSVWQSDRVCS